MNMLFAIRKAALFLTIILILSSCKNQNKALALNLLSSVEKNDKRSIEVALSGLEKTESDAIRQLLLEDKLVSVSTKYSKYLHTKALIDSLYAENRYSEVYDIITKSKNEDIPSDLFGILYNHYLNINYFKVGFKHLSISSFDSDEAILSSASTPLDILLYLEYLNAKSVKLNETAYYTASLATAQYGRYIMHNNGLNNRFPSLQKKLLFKIYRNLIYMQERGNQCIELYQEISEINRSLDIPETDVTQELTTYDIAINVDKQQLSDIEINKIKSIILDDNSLLKNRSQAFNILFSHCKAFDHNSVHDEIAWIITNEATIEDIIQKNGFLMNKVVQYLYLITINLMSGNSDKEKINRYLQECDNINLYETSPWKKYYIESTMIDYHLMNNNIDSALLHVINQFNSAKQLFHSDSDHHLDDFYTEMTVGLIEVLEMKNELNEVDLSQFIRFIDQAIAQEIRLSRAKISNSGVPNSEYDQVSSKIERLTLEINDWKDIINPDNETYKELYLLYDQLRQLTPPKQEISATDASQLQQLLKKENAAILGYLKSADLCGSYFISHDDFDIKSIENKMYLEKEKLFKKMDKNNLDIPAWKDFLLSYDVSAYDHVYIIPSGFINNFPFATILPENTTWSQLYAHFALLEMKPESVSADNSIFLSFTDQATFRDKSTKKEYADLILGYKAIGNISTSLGINDDAHIIAGADLTKEAVLENLNKDIYHISTHGFANDSIANDNSILVRHNGVPSKLFTLDFDKKDSYPSFVFLDGCNTGSGHYLIGEGTYSLSRVFMKNNIKTVIKTLWEVDEEVAAFFAETFYDQWKSQNVSQAFQNAVHTTKDSFSAIQHYGAFALEGNPHLELEI